MNFEEIVDDELIRERVRRVIAEPRSRPSWSQAAKHPLVTLVVGFLLTWGVGTLLTGRISQARLAREQASARARAEAEASAAAIKELSRVIDERYSRAEMLYASLARGAVLADVRVKQTAYEESYLRWRAGLHANLFTIRDAVGRTRYSEAEQAVGGRLARHSVELDTLLLRAVERRAAGRPAGPLDGVREKLTVVSECGTYILDYLYSSLAEERARLNRESRGEGDADPPGPRILGEPVTRAEFLDVECPRAPGASGGGEAPRAQDGR
jgi:hypothetical protein